MLKRALKKLSVDQVKTVWFHWIWSLIEIYAKRLLHQVSVARGNISQIQFLTKTYLAGQLTICCFNSAFLTDHAFTSFSRAWVSSKLWWEDLNIFDKQESSVLLEFEVFTHNLRLRLKLIAKLILNFVLDIGHIASPNWGIWFKSWSVGSWHKSISLMSKNDFNLIFRRLLCS